MGKYHETYVTVRFGETDLIGHVNNSSYFIYLEHARVQFLKSLDTIDDVKDRKYILASVKCDFIAQAYFDQSLTIRTQVRNIGNKSCQLQHEIFDTKTGQPIAKGKSTVVFFDFKEQRSKMIPQQVRGQFETYLVK